MALRKTSTTDPIHVDWLPGFAPGRVGMTLAPGKCAPSTMGAPWKRSLEEDLDRLAGHFSARLLVCLLENDELVELKIPTLVNEAQKRSLEVVRLPIRDGGTPSALGPLVELVVRIRAEAAAGTSVVIHCAAGLGRSGVVAGSVLIADGKSAAEAIDILHQVRGPRSPENHHQERFLEAVERHFSETAPSRQSRYLGAVIGAAVGDAMGHPTEFIRLPAILERWGGAGVQGFELFWERDGKRFAPYTDDTQMAEIVLRVLLESRAERLDLDATMQRLARDFIHWERSPQGGHRAPGNACVAGCRALAGGVYWSEAGGPTAGGCGSVMRAYPFGLVFADDLERAERWAVEHSKLTHRDPIALAACAAMAVGTALALHHEAEGTVVEAMITAAARYSSGTADMLRRAHDEALSGVGPDVTLQRLQAWAAHEAIAAAVYIFARHADAPRAAILEGANTDGDSDSIATLAGALVGARCGLEALPLDWVAQVERSAELLELAARL